MLLTAITDAQPDGNSTYLNAIRYEARRFLLAEHGQWKQSRHMWCEMAGLEPEVFDVAMKQRLL